MPGSARGDAPFWWYDDTQSRASRLAASALAPVAAIYGRIAEARLNRAPLYRSRLPVICVGNFTAGGTGKTPLVRTICAHLSAAGLNPVVLSRGYGGSVQGPHLVDRALDTAASVGDEPLLIANDCRVVVSRDRAAGARFIEALHPTAGVIVMDDGLQNPTLHKDIRIAVVDRIRGIGNGRVIPAGPLRAPIKSQLHQTGMIALVTPPDAHLASAKPAILADFVGIVFDTHITPAADTAWLAESSVVAYAGIGNPGRFFALLEHHGARIADRITFPDHHAFNDADAEKLLARARALNATLVTTEKDLMRLTGAQGIGAELAKKSRALPIMAVIEPHGWTAIAEALARHKRAR